MSEVVAPPHKAISECGCHKVEIIKVCGTYNNLYLFLVYCNPDGDDGIYDSLLVSMATIQESDRNSSFLNLLDFNVHHREWLNSISQTDHHCFRALDFSSESGSGQIIHSPTHRSDNCLDIIFADTHCVVTGDVGSPIRTSDHCLESPVIKIDPFVPDVPFSCNVCLKSQADWDGILIDLLELDWADIYINVDYVVSKNDAFERVIVSCIPSLVIKFHIKEKAWFNEDCRKAYLAKLEAYQLWRRNSSDNLE